MPLPSQTYLRPAAAASWRLPRGNGSGGGARQRARRQRRARVSLCRQQRTRTRRATADAAGPRAGVMGVVEVPRVGNSGDVAERGRAWAGRGLARGRVGAPAGLDPPWSLLARCSAARPWPALSFVRADASPLPEGIALFALWSCQFAPSRAPPRSPPSHDTTAPPPPPSISLAHARLFKPPCPARAATDYPSRPRTAGSEAEAHPRLVLPARGEGHQHRRSACYRSVLHLSPLFQSPQISQQSVSSPTSSLLPPP